jgi:hypothetical protein
VKLVSEVHDIVCVLLVNMQIVASFRDAESYGQHTAKQLQALQASRAPAASAPPYEHRPFTQGAIRWIINICFFTIPWTYLAHVKSSSEYRGRLSTVQHNWEAYIERLVQEYSDFLLIVRRPLYLHVPMINCPIFCTSLLCSFRKSIVVCCEKHS